MAFHHCYSPILFSTGVLILLLQGVCAGNDVTTMSAVVGESVVLPSGYQRSEVQTVEWNFIQNNRTKMIAELSKTGINVHFKSQFKGRLKMNSSDLSLTVSELTHADSGLFSPICTNNGDKQLKTKSIQLQVYDSTLTVDIQKNVTLHPLNNTCTVSLLCNASGPPDIQFSWSGHRNGSGAKLHFSLSPVDVSVTSTCNASKGNDHKLVTETMKCSNKTSDDLSIEWYLVVIPAAGGVPILVIVITIVIGVCCYKRHKADSSKQDTVYADVIADQKKNTERSTSVQYEMTLYESVDDRAIGRQNNPQTVYDKVNFSRPEMKKDVGVTLSSPYQDVL